MNLSNFQNTALIFLNAIEELIKGKAYLTGFVIGAFKVIMAISSHSALLLIHAVYNITKASVVYLIYSVYIFVFGCDSAYLMYVAIGIAAITAYELVVAIYGIRKAKKKNDICLSRMKLTCQNPTLLVTPFSAFWL